MKEIENQIGNLTHRIDQLERSQSATQQEITKIREELNELKQSQSKQSVSSPSIDPVAVALKEIEEDKKPNETIDPIATFLENTGASKGSKASNDDGFDWEAFIGENVISKIGIIITIIGAVIGTKYSIDHDLITPQMRLVLGGIFGLALLGVGIKLKPKYDMYSAVLSSGALCILYFTVFASYNFYGFISQVLAFGFMFCITAGGVYLALWHKKQVIAHIGLVGAYAVPLLLSDGSGKVAFLFAFTSLINAGILVIAFSKNWRELRFTSFAFTWLIFIAWYLDKGSSGEFVALSLAFLSSNFLLFYASILAFKLKKHEEFDKLDVALIMSNTFVFYALGYLVISDYSIGTKFLGLFTCLVAGAHFLAAYSVYKRQLVDRNLFHFLLGLSFVFVVIAAPVQFDGNWVTLIWTGQALALFYVGRSKEKLFYEQLAYPLMLIASFSMFEDCLAYSQLRPSLKGYTILNIQFITSLLFASAFGYIVYLQNTTKQLLQSNSEFKNKFQLYLAPTVLLFAAFFTFRLELSQFWLAKIHFAESHYDKMNFQQLKTIWEVNYNVLFCVSLVVLNIQKLKSNRLSLVSLGLSAFSSLLFLIVGLYAISELREEFLSVPIGNRSFALIAVRYISAGFFALLLCCVYQYRKSSLLDFNFSNIFGASLHISIIWYLSSELLHWLDFAEVANSYKLWLSILWGVYSLSLIGYGILKGKKYLRIMAISLFGVTLLKLFVYDIAHHNSISKTIVFLSLGVLLLIISFLYNKFKSRIHDENQDEKENLL
jgi:uncharacterized membrane protein